LGFVNRTQLLKTKEDLAASQQETVTVKNGLDAESKKLAEAQKSLSDLTAQKTTLDTDLTKQKSDLADKSKQLTETQSELASAKGKLETANTDILTKAEKITQLEAQIATATAAQQTPAASDEDKARITELETLNTKLGEDNQNLESKLAALQKAAREKETKQGLTRVTGRVLAVNQAWNFVVLSLGNKSGVESNMEFLVKRGSTLIGKVRTTTVEPASSIADIIPASLTRGLSIQPGDDFIYQTAQN
jgi:DNA repair exonuclease SbcCD ATPase subunit